MFISSLIHEGVLFNRFVCDVMLGMHDPFTVCCGNGFMCAQRDFNQTLLGTACTDPSRYINWDGMHYTESANQFVAQLVVNGSLSDPPLPVAEACRHTA